jgi:hypothetical protein
MQSLESKCKIQGRYDGGFLETLFHFCAGEVVLLEAYFDESQRSNGLMCVAGLAFSKNNGLKLIKELRAVFGQRYLHMKELIPKQKQFKGISDPERDRFLKSAVSIVRNRLTYGVAITVNVHEYERVAPKFIRGLRTPYPFLCHMAMTAMAERARLFEDSRPITYVFEDGHECQFEAQLMVGLMSTSPELRERYQYGGHAFVPKAQAPPLQAADLLAWEVAKFKVESVDPDGATARPIRQSLLNLVASDTKRFNFAFCGGESLERTMKKYAALGVEQVMEERAAKAQRRIEHERKRQLRCSHEEDTQGL